MSKPKNLSELLAALTAEGFKVLFHANGNDLAIRIQFDDKVIERVINRRAVLDSNLDLLFYEVDRAADHLKAK